MAAVAIAACAPRTPIDLAPAIDPAAIEEIVLLPVIDARAARFEQVQIARNVADATRRLLREHGYFVVESDRFRERPAERLDLREASAEELVALAPEDADHFLVIQLERLEREIDEDGESYNAQLTAVLVDRDARQVLWRDVASASSSLSGVLTVFSRGSRQYEAAVNAVRALVETLPARGPAKRRG